MVQMVIGIVIAICIWGAITYIYMMQKKEESLYNEVTKLIENDNIRKMINTLTVSTAVVVVTLLISLVLSIFFPSFEWGWVDRNTLITTIATIMGGFFGFIGAAIGVIGTYGAFYLGANSEKQKEESHKKIMLYNFLEHTIIETEHLVKNLHEYSVRYGNMFKDEDRDICNRVKSLMDIIVRNKYDNMFYMSIYAIVLGGRTEEFKLPKNRYGARLQAELDSLIDIDRIDLSKLLYDDNWTTYLDCLDDHEKIQTIVNWVNLLRNSLKEVNVLEFLKYRNQIIKVIDEEYPEVKNGSIRGIREKVEETLESITQDVQ